MQVRARVSQSDINLIMPGQAAKIRLDAYPDLLFDGRVETLAPLGVASGMTPKVRAFTAVVSITGMDPQLMPDLSASVEIVPGRANAAPATRGRATRPAGRSVACDSSLPPAPAESALVALVVGRRRRRRGVQPAAGRPTCPRRK